MDEDTINCPSCGKSMKKDARMCIHCGYMNFDNKENDNYKKVYDKVNKQSIFSRFTKPKVFDDKVLIRKNKNKSLSNYNMEDMQTTYTTNEVSNDNYIGKSKKTDKEKSYGRKQLILTIIILIIFLSIGYSFYKHKDNLSEFIFNIPKDIFIKDVDKKVDLLKNSINEFNCKTSSDNKYYYKISDITQKNSSFDSSSGYIMVDKSTSDYKYYVTYSNGTYAVINTLYEDINYNNVVKQSEVYKPSGSIVWCER